MGVEFTFDFEKFLEAVRYLASRGLPDLSKYKICKLLFLADKYHLVRYGRTITGDRYCAIKHGPIPSRGLNILNGVLAADETPPNDPEVAKAAEKFNIDRKYVYPQFQSKTRPKPENLSKSDRAALDHVIKNFGNKDFFELKTLTHGIYAYKVAWEKNPSAQMEEMQFEDFFEEDPDAIVGAREAMEENFGLREAFGK